MEHIGLVLVLMVFGIGTAASAQAVILKGRHPIYYLKIHAGFLMLLNTIVFFGLLFNYIQFNVMKGMPPVKARGLFGVYYLILSAVTVLLLYVFAEMIVLLLKREEGIAKIRFLLLGYFGGLVLAQFVFLVLDTYTGEIPLYIVVFLIISVSFFLAGYGFVLWLLSGLKAYSGRSQRRILQIAVVFFFFVITASILLDALQVFTLITLELYLILKALVIIAVNLVSLTRLKVFVKEVFPEKTAGASTEGVVESLYNRYKIAPREQEIIRLICAGQSSREIGKELFLSSHTIKEYIYRIYKKTGVKNRVQLVNLFRGG